ncbi:MAG: hypothetical protein HY644_15545 [Acidobacteria bacterium]|nr:hypothetical protein [Acidobacteriota bacterium]
MTRGKVGYGWNEVPEGSEKIVAYAPLDIADRRWTIAISESMDATTALAQQSTRQYTLNAILLSIVVLATAVYITRMHHLRHQAEQEAQHLHEQRLLQEQLDRNHLQLLEAERFATVGKMAAQVAHEIKNPLSSISLNTELLSDELEADGREPRPEARQLIHSIISEIDLLTGTIDDYLQFAHFPKLQKKKTFLGDIFGGLQQLLQEESASRAIALQFSVHRSLPPFSADARLLRQALLNLIRNSFDAVGNKGRVRVEASGQNGYVRMEIIDSGPGVSPESVPMLFEPFFTTKPKGTGLGLVVARHIIFEHGGTIKYEPTTAGLSRFVITIPLEQIPPREEQA